MMRQGSGGYVQKLKSIRKFFFFFFFFLGGGVISWGRGGRGIGLRSISNLD